MSSTMKVIYAESRYSQMIKVTVTPSSANRLYTEVENKILGIRELSSGYAKKEMLDAAFSIAALKFVKSTNLLARSQKSSFHHIYEWEEVGKETGRLFRLIKKNNSLGTATVYTRFNFSKKKAPISKVLRTAGNNGKSVTRSGIFKNKASIMEEGKPVGFITTRTIAFEGKGKQIVFVPPGKSILIRNPGGKGTTGSFSKHFIGWWNLNFPHTLDQSGVIRKLESSVARALRRKGAGKTDVRVAISKTLAPYKMTRGVI